MPFLAAQPCIPKSKDLSNRRLIQRNLNVLNASGWEITSAVKDLGRHLTTLPGLLIDDLLICLDEKAYNPDSLFRTFDTYGTQIMPAAKNSFLLTFAYDKENHRNKNIVLEQHELDGSSISLQLADVRRDTQGNSFRFQLYSTEADAKLQKEVFDKHGMRFHEVHGKYESAT